MEAGFGSRGLRTAVEPTFFLHAVGLLTWHIEGWHFAGQCTVKKISFLLSALQTNQSLLDTTFNPSKLNMLGNAAAFVLTVRAYHY